MTIDPKVTDMMNEGRWFWSDDFVTPHNNPLLGELERTYSIVLRTIEYSKESTIVNDLIGTGISRGLLLKHIMLLSDTSAETLDRAAMYIKHHSLTQLTLPDRVVPFLKLQSLKSGLSNHSIYKADVGLTQDILNLLTFAYRSEEFKKFDTFKNCKLAVFAGNVELLKEHLLYLSIRSSSQIKQIRAVDFGAQLEAKIDSTIEPTLIALGIEKTRRYKGQQFDKVLVKGPKHIILEIAFQETTNSTLERKSKQAKNGLYKEVDDNGDKLVYVVDGAGYFRRNNALKDLIEYSHFSCTVSDLGLSKLIEFINEYFGSVK